jgi:plasmid maintenance system antidote protein VapI
MKMHNPPHPGEIIREYGSPGAAYDDNLGQTIFSHQRSFSFQ